jgi:hypothetical protein
MGDQRLNKFKKQWLAEEREDIDALNNSILASCVSDCQTFFESCAFDNQSEGELVELLLPKKDKEIQL